MTKTSLAALLLVPALALANGYDVPNVNPRDLALAGSGVAAQADAAAVYGNPAALSRLPGLNLSLAGSILDIETSWTAPAGSGLSGSASTKFRPAPPVSLFASYGTELFGRGAGVGFGMNIPGGGNVFWNDDWQGRGRIITVDRKLYGFYLTGGYAVLPQLRLGGGVSYVYTAEYLKIGIQPFEGAYGELSTKGGGFSFDLSAELQPLADVPLTLGVDYKHKTTMNLTGDGNFVVPPGVESASTQDQNARHQLTFPNALHVGLAYRPTPPLLVTFAYTFNRYVVYGDDVFAGDKGFVIEVPRHYGNGYTFRLGGEYGVTSRATVRAGVLRDVSGLDRAAYSPTLPDSNAWAGALGGGWRFSNDLAVNATFFYAWLDKVTSTSWRTTASPTTGTFPGIYDTNVWVLSVGATWRTDLGGGR